MNTRKELLWSLWYIYIYIHSYIHIHKICVYMCIYLHIYTYLDLWNESFLIVTPTPRVSTTASVETVNSSASVPISPGHLALELTILSVLVK